ncbi:MAG: histidinol-phosphatase HisJ family protein [Clostridiales bacterium]|jgi:histidinol-phosphatase (PHP family)|nr:histidinol-phosphatase HisJ family protein [Clostridiales bacterium]
MISADLHVHTNFSSDSNTSVEMQIEKAASIGLQTICITDHQDFDYPSRIQGPEYQLDVNKYFKKMNDMKNIYKEKIEVLTGVELGLMPNLKEKIQNFTKKYDFDFLIGSSHLVNGKDPYFRSFYENRIEKEAYNEYFISILENVKKFDEYNIYGHLDYVVRYGPNKNKFFEFKDYAETIEEILKIIISKGKGIEINTSGLLRSLGYPHPHGEILKMYKKLGGEIITIGSDAHVSENIGFEFNTIENLLKNYGFKYYVVFRKRTPTFYKI